MTFLNPILVSIGLGCIAIPIIIHLLMRRRRKPVQWGAMKFLLEAYRKQRRRLNLEQLLLLASRCLLVALLALALGKPILGAAAALGVRGPRTLYLLIDNSLTATQSATQAGTTGSDSALDQLKMRAAKVLASLDASRGDRVGIVALAGPADSVIMPPTPDLASAGAIVKSIQGTASRADLDGAAAKVRDEIRRAAKDDRGRDALVVLLSEFRTGSADTGTTLRSLAETETPPRIIAIPPAEQGIDNTTLVAAEPLQSVVLTAEAAAGSSTGAAAVSTPVRIELHRSGPGVTQGAVTNLRLSIAPPRESRASGPGGVTRQVRWDPGQETRTITTSVDFTAGQNARAGLVLRASIDRDAIETDNTFERPVEVRERLRVAVVAPTNTTNRTSLDRYTPADWFTLALEPVDDGTLRTRRAGEVDVQLIDPARDLGDPRGGSLGPLAAIDAVIITSPQLVDAVGWRRVRAASDTGSLVLVTPPAAESVHNWTDAFLDAMGLDWTIARETKSLTTPGAIEVDHRASSGGDLLALIAPELADIAKPVTVSRFLPVTSKSGSLESVLALTDGSPLVVTGSTGQRRGGTEAPATTPSPTQPTSTSPVASIPTKDEGRAGRGLVVFIASAMDLSWTDLPTKPLMVPMVQELVRQGFGRGTGVRAIIAGSTPLLPPGTAELLSVSASDTNSASTNTAPSNSSDSSVIPIDSTGRPASPLRMSGLWRGRNGAGANTGLLAVNADPAAGRTEPRAKDDVGRWLGGLGTKVEWLEGLEVTGGGSGSSLGSLDKRDELPPISLPLLIAAALIALVELVLSKVFSHAHADSTLQIIAPTVAATSPATSTAERNAA